MSSILSSYNFQIFIMSSQQSFGLCPACGIPHQHPQIASSLGPRTSYGRCLDAAKEFSKDLQDRDAQKTFMKCTMDFIKQHSKESYEAIREAEKRKKDMPIISKPYFIFNTACDSDDWRKSSI